uniref:Uncharacterized protein n=1 Tax=Prymnesium polylepis TaxID=72548 RepID=A0A7S4JDG4_9EUKA
MLPTNADDALPPTLVLDAVPSSVERRSSDDGTLLPSRKRERSSADSPRKRICLLGHTASPPTSCAARLLEIDRVWSSAAHKERPTLSSILSERVSMLEATIECAAGLLGLSESGATENARPAASNNPSAPIISRTPLLPPQPVDPTVSTGQESRWWTPELLARAVEYGLPTPAINRHAWQASLLAERNLSLQRSVSLALQQTAGF